MSQVPYFRDYKPGSKERDFLGVPRRARPFRSQVLPPPFPSFLGLPAGEVSANAMAAAMCLRAEIPKDRNHILDPIRFSAIRHAGVMMIPHQIFWWAVWTLVGNRLPDALQKSIVAHPEALLAAFGYQARSVSSNQWHVFIDCPEFLATLPKVGNELLGIVSQAHAYDSRPR